jgi:neutral ceramidase
VKETFDAWVNGISNAAIEAHKNLQPAKGLINSGMLYDSNINRSPTSYELNPEDEKANYPEGNTDKTMLLLSFFSKQHLGKPMGSLNWFAVHGTALNNTNTLVSGDNKGYAAYLLEREFNGAEVPAGHGEYVGAFASTNLGDVSPNTQGAKCIDTGLPCEGTTSSCNGKCQNCIAFGPGKDQYESCQIIGDKQFQFAKKLISEAKEPLMDSVVDFRHSWVKMPGLNVTLASGATATLCEPSMGYSFAAGTTDGPGMFSFTQGTTTGNPFWDKVSAILAKPTEEEIKCQAPKPILINSCDIDVPHEWDPQTVPVQILRIGNVFILSAPGELTTMAGRRLRNAVRSILETGHIVPKGTKIYVTIAGLTNTYSSYITTYEEYQAQRYEAASTIYGPHTLEGYIQEFSRLARDMVNNVPSYTGAPPVDYQDVMIQMIPEPRFDRVADGKKFGEIVEEKDVQPAYKAGELAQVTFHAANPRNDQHTEGTFLTVEKKTEILKNGMTVFKTVATDADFNTRFEWRAGPEDYFDFGVSKQSIATLSWYIPNDVVEGTYRMCYEGDHKIGKMAKIVPFRGCSSEFTVSSTVKAHSNKHERKLQQ